MESTKENVREGVVEAKSSLLRIAEEHRRQAAGKFNDYRRAAAAAAGKLKEDGDEALGEHLQDLTRKLADLSNYLGNTKVKNLAKDLGNYTRKNPEIMLGGTLLAGFALARFLKASSHDGDAPSSTDLASSGNRSLIVDTQTYTIR